MPTYEYACTACGERTEAKQGFDDPPLDTCLVCGGKLRKLYSPVGIVFRGTGFYSTDGRKKPDKSGSTSTAKNDSAGKRSDKSSGTSESDNKSTSSKPSA